MSYCQSSDVGVLLGLTYDANSVPTLTQVNSVIDQVSAEIDMNLRQIGITSVSDATVLLYLKMVCAKGSACYIGSVYFNNIQNVNGTISNFYCIAYKEELKKIIDNPAIMGAAGGSIEVHSDVIDGLNSEADYDDISIQKGRFNY